MPDDRGLEDLLPLPSSVLHIATALAHGPLHGYAIMKAVEEETEGRVRLGPGSLYGTVRKMLDDGMITEVDAPAAGAGEDGAGDERRRYYALTIQGRRLLAMELDRLERLLQWARSGRRLGKAEGSR